jgi:hypothetical protein
MELHVSSFRVVSCLAYRLKVLWWPQSMEEQKPEKSKAQKSWLLLQLFPIQFYSSCSEIKTTTSGSPESRCYTASKRKPPGWPALLRPPASPPSWVLASHSSKLVRVGAASSVRTSRTSCTCSPTSIISPRSPSSFHRRLLWTWCSMTGFSLPKLWPTSRKWKKCPNLRDSHRLPGVFRREVDYEYK